MGRVLEVCVASLAEACAAEEAGADRLVLNSGLQLGGLTPSPALLQAVVGTVKIPVVAMSRPRAGGFCYCSDDWRTLVADARWMIEQGVRGIAFGCLTADRLVDTQRVAEVVSTFPDCEWVFHRAFDLIEDWQTALKSLVDCGVTRIMTSGGADKVPNGLERIRETIELAADQIEVIPAGGVTPCNIEEIVKSTGCTQAHGTFSSLGNDEGYLDGPFRFAVNDDLRVTNPDKVRRAKEALTV